MGYGGEREGEKGQSRKKSVCGRERQQLPFQKRDREREHRLEEAGDDLLMFKHMSL